MNKLLESKNLCSEIFENANLIETLKDNPYHLELAEKTFENCKAALEGSAYVIKHVPIEFKELYDFAIEENPHCISAIKNPSKELCLKAVRLNGLCLDGIKNQTPEICLAAINQDGKAYRMVKICENKFYQRTVKLLKEMYRMETNKKQILESVRSLVI